MNSYLSYITCDDPTGGPRDFDPKWLTSPLTEYTRLCATDKALFLLDQSFMMNYLDRVYDKGLPYILTSYKHRLLNRWLPELKREDLNDSSIRQMITDIEYLLTGKGSAMLNVQPSELNIKTPMSTQLSFYRPYRLYLLRLQDLDRGMTAASVNPDTSSDDAPTHIPTFVVSGKTLQVSYRATFPQYKVDYNRLLELKNTQAGFTHNSIFAYLLGYDWTSYDMAAPVGLLTSYALELDVNAFPKDSLLWGYYDLYKRVLHWDPPIAVECNNRSSAKYSLYRRCILNFIVELQKKYNVSFTDKALLASIIGDETRNADQLRKFITSSSGDVISVEMYNAFRESIFGAITELDPRQTTRHLDRGYGQFFDAKKTEDDDLDTEMEDTSKPKKKPKRSGPSKGKILDEDESTTGDDSEDTDENPEEDKAVTTGKDKTVDAEDSTDPEADDETPTEDDQAANDESSHTQDNTHTQDDELPKLPEMSDKKGIKIELSGKMDAKSVLYLMELRSYVDTILANPPKQLSSQSMEALRRIRVHWWGLLAPRCLQDLVKMVVQIPNKLSIGKGQ